MFLTNAHFISALSVTELKSIRHEIVSTLSRLQDHIKFRTPTTLPIPENMELSGL